MPIKLKPIGDRILVSQEQTDNKTKSGIYLADAAQHTWLVGTVLAVGEKVYPTIKVGDRIMYNSYFLTLEKVGFIVRSGDVYGHVEDVPEEETTKELN